MDPLGMNKTGHDDLSTPRRRLTMDLNRPERISLFQGKQVQENKIMPTRKGMNYDPIDFIDSSFDIPRSKRRRTIQRDEILNSQTENDILSQQNHNLKRPALDNDHLETRQPLDRNVEPSTSIAPESKDKDIVLLKERISLLENHIESIVNEYEKLKNIRTTEQENALANNLEWAQVKDDAYITLRDQAEVFMSKKWNMHNTTARNNTKKDETEELRAKVASVQKELEHNKDFSKLVNGIYEDLTGVVVTGAKKGDKENLYKCIIVGKAGTFQFSLSISKEQNGLVFYSPVLDQERDAELMSALPEFLKESVEFERDDLPIFFYRLSSIIN